MLRQDGERKAQLLKQADKDKRSLNKQYQDVQYRLEQSNASLVQLMEENTNLKKSESSEKMRLKAQNEKLQGLCRVLRKTETAAVSPSAAADGSASTVDEATSQAPLSPDTVNGDQNAKAASLGSSVSADLSDVMSQALTISAENSSASVDDGSTASLTQ